MTVATTTAAGRAVVHGDDPSLQENASAKLARKRAEAQRAANALNVGSVPLETLPEPPRAAKPSRPTTLAEAAPWLLKPFAKADIEVKISATNREKTKGLASPYADMRCYYTRLDKICGVEHWSSSITLTDRGAVCSLTIFGVTKSATGDYPAEKGDENIATSAEAQAFKRACSAFGLGRYLYSLGDTWAELTPDGKRFIDPAGVVARMYASLPRGEE